jgi:hypothetical protein
MRPVHRRQPELFEEPRDRRPTPPEHRQAMIEILGALLTEAIVRQAPVLIGKEVRHEPHRG